MLLSLPDVNGRVLVSCLEVTVQDAKLQQNWKSYCVIPVFSSPHVSKPVYVGQTAMLYNSGTSYRKKQRAEDRETDRSSESITIDGAQNSGASKEAGSIIL